MSPTIDQPSIADYVDAFRRRLKLCLTIFGLVFGITLIVALGLEDYYQSSSEMRIDLQGPNLDLLEPLELTNYADQYIASLAQLAITDDAIKEWIDGTNVFSDRKENEKISDLIEDVSDGIEIELVTTTVTDPSSGKPVDLITGFTIAYDAAKPIDAMIITEKATAAFLEKDREIRTERAAAASGFLREEIDLKRQQISELEATIAEFKEANAGSLPELMGLNMSVAERTERDLQEIDRKIRSLQQDRIFRETQLEEIRQKSGSADRLKQLEADYLRAISIYGPDHPDVVRIGRQVAAMTSDPNDGGESSEIQRVEMELAAAKQRYSDLHPDVVSLQRRLQALRATAAAGSNVSTVEPAYLQLRAQINAIDSELSGLRNSAYALKEKYDEFQDRIARMPQVEREYLVLARDLQTAQLAFEDLRKRMAQAQQTESFESGNRGARLVQLRDAYLPDDPSGPPRLAIGILGFVLAASLSMGAVLTTEAADGTIRNTRDIRMIVNTMPIAEIPVIVATESGSAMRRRIWVIGTALLLIGAAILIVARDF